MGHACDAFPRGVPTEILASVKDHRRPIDGDRGLTFEPLTENEMPPVSEAQRRLMWAAAAGHVKGVPPSVGKEFASTDPGGKLPARAKDLAPEKFSAIKNALRYLVEFFSEEEREPEHEGQDADPPRGRAASVAFVCPDGRTLFVRRRATDESDHYAGKWCWPGGRCEEDEEFADAAMREAREEAGEDCTFDNMSELHRVRTDRGWDHVTYVVPVKAPFQPTLDDECDGHVWATPDALPEPLHPGCKRTMDESFAKVEHSLAHRKGVKDPDALAAWIGRKSGAIKDESAEEKARNRGALTERERQVANPHVEARANKPKSVYLLPEEEKYPVKTREAGEWKYSCGLLLAAAREARMHGRTDLARRADAIREREFGEEREGAKDASPWAVALGKAAERRHATDWSRFGPPKRRQIAMDKSMRELDADGRMHVNESNISKATINPYLGREIPGWEKLGLDPEKKYMLLRDPDELKKAADSFNGLPIFDKHRPASATDHPKEITVGATGNDAKFEHPYLKNSLVIWPEYATKAVENGDLGEISCGYAYRPDMTPGTYDGQHYDGVMRDIVGNHVAIVREGRAGPDVKVADELNRRFTFRLLSPA